MKNISPGISQLCTDLDIPAEDFRILVFAWKCQANVMCQFSRSEFIQGNETNYIYMYIYL